MADENLGTARITIELDDVGALADAEQLRRDLEQTLDQIDTIRVRIEADARPFESTVDTLHNFPPVSIEILPDIDEAEFEARIQAVADGLEVSVRVVPDFDDFDVRIRAHDPPDVNVQVHAEVDRDRFEADLSGLGSIAGKVGSQLTGLLRFGAVGIAATGAAQGVGGFVAALAPAAGIVAALPAVLAGAKVALGVFKLATVGVGDAVSALAEGDMKAFEEALQKLSPAAQEALGSLKEVAPELKKIQQAVQDSFFQAFGADIKGAVDNLLPLKPELQGIAEEMGVVVDEALRFVATDKGFANIGNVLQGTGDAISGISKGIQPLLAGLTGVAGEVAVAFGARFGNAIGGLLERFGNFLDRLATTGQAVKIVENAITVFKQLGTIIGNVGSILGTVFRLANQAGGGLLNNLITLTGALRTFVESAAGQDAIINIFQAVAEAAKQLGPIIAALIKQVGAIAPGILKVFAAIGPAIVSIIDALGPAIQAIVPSIVGLANTISQVFQAIASSGVLASIGKAIGGLVTALTPVLKIVGLLAIELGKVLAPALEAVNAFITPLVDALATALGPVLTIVGDALAKVAQALVPVFSALGQLAGGIITALAPLLQSLAEAFAQIANAVAPLITQLVEALMPLLPPLIQSFSGWVNALLPLIPAITDLALAFVPLIEKLIQVAAEGAPAFAQIMTLVQTQAVIPAIEGIVNVLVFLINGLTLVVDSVINAKRNTIAEFNALKLAVETLINNLKIRVSQLWSDIRTNITSAATNAKNTVISTFSNLKTQAINLFNLLVADARAVFARLPGNIQNALSGAGNALFGAGRQLVQGLINGVRSAAGDLASQARSVVEGAINAAKSALGIHSPSKVFAEIGRQTGAGLVQGIEGSGAAVARAAQRMADTAGQVTVSGATIGGVSTAGTGLATTLVGGAQSAAAIQRSSARVADRNITFNITEVGDGTVTAQRVVNRLVAGFAV